MSWPIHSPQTQGGVAPATRARGVKAAGAGAEAAAGGTSSEAAAKTASAPAVLLDALPSSPPAEVLAAMQTAAHTYDALRAQGLEVGYVQDPSTGRTVAQLRDSSGAVVRTLSTSEAIALAAGEAGPEIAEG